MCLVFRSTTACVSDSRRATALNRTRSEWTVYVQLREISNVIDGFILLCSRSQVCLPLKNVAMIDEASRLRDFTLESRLGQLCIHYSLQRYKTIRESTRQRTRSPEKVTAPPMMA